jgi:threonine dehydrogenase-like Zn-dependent dehydrogenase
VATELIATGQVDLRPLIDATYSIEEAQKAFEHATSKPSYRVIIKP